MSLPGIDPSRVYGEGEQSALLDAVADQLAEQWGSTPRTADETPAGDQAANAPVDPNLAEGGPDSPPPSGSPEAAPAPAPTPTPADPALLPPDVSPTGGPGELPTGLPGESQGTFPPGSPPPAPAPGDTGVEAGPATEPPPVSPTFTDPARSVDAGAVLEAAYGRPVQAGEMQELLGFLNTLNSLPPDRAAIVAAAIEGRELPGSQPPVAPAPPQPAPDSPFEYDGQPAAAPTPDPRIDELLARQSAMEQQAFAQQDMARRQLMDVGAREFIAAVPFQLTKEEFDILETRAMQGGAFPANLNRSGDPRAAWKDTLTSTMWADPAFQDRLVAARTATPPADTRARQTAAAALSPVTTAASASPVPVTAMTPQERQAALTRAAADMMARNTQSG